jgi:hypothetical protein
MTVTMSCAAAGFASFGKGSGKGGEPAHDRAPRENGSPGTQYMIPVRPWPSPCEGSPCHGRIMAHLRFGKVSIQETKD